MKVSETKVVCFTPLCFLGCCANGYNQVILCKSKLCIITDMEKEEEVLLQWSDVPSNNYLKLAQQVNNICFSCSTYHPQHWTNRKIPGYKDN